MAFNRSKIARARASRATYRPVGTFATLGLNFYMLPHEVDKTLHLRPFLHISAFRGGLTQLSKRVLQLYRTKITIIIN